MLRRATLLVTLAGCLVAPSLARASGADVIRDCERHGEVTGHYSQSELQNALDTMPADLKEYSNCEEAIRQAQEHAAIAAHQPSHRSGGGTNSSGGGTSGGGSGGGSGSSAGGGSSSLSDPQAQSHAGRGPIAHAAKAAKRKINAGDAYALKVAQSGAALRAKRPLAGAAVTPSAASSSSGGLGSLPTSLLVVLILLGAGALGSLVVAGRRTSLVGRVLARNRP
jgi:hypothetical protein